MLITCGCPAIDLIDSRLPFLHRPRPLRLSLCCFLDSISLSLSMASRMASTAGTVRPDDSFDLDPMLDDDEDDDDASSSSSSASSSSSLPQTGGHPDLPGSIPALVLHKAVAAGLTRAGFDEADPDALDELEGALASCPSLSLSLKGLTILCRWGGC